MSISIFGEVPAQGRGAGGKPQPPLLRWGAGGAWGRGAGGAGLGGGSQCVVAEAVTSSRVLEDTFHVIIKAKIKDILKPTLKL